MSQPARFESQGGAAGLAEPNGPAADSRACHADAADRSLRLPSGRSVVVWCRETDERIEVRSPDGSIEVQISLRADEGPVVRLSGARLELNAVESLALSAGRIELASRENIAVQAGGSVAVDAREFRVQTEDDVHLRGEHIRLNCPDP